MRTLYLSNSFSYRSSVDLRGIKLLLPLILILLIGSPALWAQRSVSIGSTQQFTTASGNVRIATVDDRHIIALYKNGSTVNATDLYARVGEVDTASQAITWGNATLIDSALNSRAAIMGLNGSQAVAAYSVFNGTKYIGVARVLNIDTSTNGISIGNATTFHNDPIDPAYSHTPISMVKLSGSKLAICFADDATDNGQVVIANVSGLSITFGAANEWSTGDVQNFWIDTLGTNAIIISYEDDGSSADEGKVIAGTVSGTSVTFATPSTFYSNGGSSSVSYTSIKSLGDSSFIVVYARDAVNEGYAVAGTYDGATYSFGAHHRFDYSTSSTGPLDISIAFAFGLNAVDPQVAVGYNTGSGDTSYMAVFDVNALSITSAVHDMLTTQADDSWMTLLNENTLCYGYVNDNPSDQGEVKVIRLEPKYGLIVSEDLLSEVPGAGYALHFDGIDDYVSIDDANALDLSSNFTIEAWVKVYEDPTNDAPIVSKPRSSIGSGFSLRVVNGMSLELRLQNGVTGADVTSPANALKAGKWHHVAGTFNGTIAKLYVDGQLVQSAAASILPVIGIEDMYIGIEGSSASLNNQIFKGNIDEVRIWNTPLTQDQLREWICTKVNWNHSNIDNMVAYYRFDNAGGGNVTDFISGNDGVLNNMDTLSDWEFSGASIGDRAKLTDVGATLIDTLDNGNIVKLGGFNTVPDLAYLYVVEDTAIGSAYDMSIISPDSLRYFGVHLVGGDKYDLEIDYTSNTFLNSSNQEYLVYGIKRSSGEDPVWKTVGSQYRVDSIANKIWINNQRGTEYVTGFAVSSYPVRPGSGYALTFDGLDDHVAIQEDSSLHIADTISIGFWVNPASSQLASAAIISKQAAGGLGYAIEQNVNDTNQYHFYWGNGTTFTNAGFTINLTENEWQHVCVVKEGANALYYLNGVLAGGGTGSFATVTNTNVDLFLGKNNANGNHWEGQLDELTIWNTALDSNTVRDWMCKKLNTSHPKANSLIAYYRFDYAGDTMLYDLVDGLDGVLTNMDTAQGWINSGAALGDISLHDYSSPVSLNTSLSNGNAVLVDDLTGSPDGIQLYVVSDVPEGSTFPGSTTVDSSTYFGVFMVNGTNYDVTVDYSANAWMNGAANEINARGFKRENGGDATWAVATGFFDLNTFDNTITFSNQSGTEYVTGFNNAAYPARPGSGWALDFDGTGAMVTTASSGLSDISTQDSLTLEVWVNVSEGASGYDFIYNSEDASSSRLRISMLNGKPRFTFRDAALNGFGIQSLDSIADADWHHLAFVYTGTETPAGMKIYIDGLLASTTNVSSGTLTTGNLSDSAYIGRQAALTNSFVGQMDEMRIWAAALDQTTVKDWMCKKLNVLHPNLDNLRSYYRFDESSGDTLNDLSGGATGVLANAPVWIRSGAPLGDESVHSYPAATIVDTLANNNIVSIDGFEGSPDGIHLYLVNDTAEGTSYPTTIVSADSSEYFGVFMVNGNSYDVTIDYAANTAINGAATEQRARALKRSGGDAADWEVASGILRTDVDANKIYVYKQSGTEYVTGFSNTSYPDRVGSGRALSFDGSDEYVLWGNPSSLQLDTYTLELWFYSLDNTRSILTKGFSRGANINRSLDLFGDGDSLKFLVGDGAGTVDDIVLGDFPTNQWTHVAVINTGTKIFGYLNGVLVDSATLTVTPNTSSFTWHTGSSTYAYKGTLDELRIWSTPLPAEDIRTWMCRKVNTAHPAFDELAAYYRFDEGNDGNLYDLAGGNHGTLSNMEVPNDWVYSGTPLGDDGVQTYGGLSLTDTMLNGNVITLDDFEGNPDGIHLYLVNDTAEYSTFPTEMSTVQNDQYFGVFMVNGERYNATIDYSANTGINASANEGQLRGLRRGAGDDPTWEVTTRALRTDINANTIIIPNQTGTEYVTGFSNVTYPARPGAGYALDFDGNNDYVELGNQPELTFTDAMTIEFWFKTSAIPGDYQTLVSKWYSAGDLNGGSYSFYYTTANGLNFGLQDSANANMSVNSGGFFNDGRWHHVAGTWDGDTARLYVDGMLRGQAGSAGFSTYLDQDTRNTRIGTDDRYAAGTGDRHFKGSIDEVRFWRTPLSEATIRAWMCKKVNVGHPGIADLEAYYRMDDATGTTLDNLAGTVTGTLNNMAADDWFRSGAALGDESQLTYGGTLVSDTMLNGNVVIVDGFEGNPEGVHLYHVVDTAVGSTYPAAMNGIDSTEYMGVFMVAGTGYELSIDYTGNAAINGTANEHRIRAMKRENGEDVSWQGASGEFRVDTGLNVISILNQSGTEYLTGFSNLTYPSRPGSGRALIFDATDDYVQCDQIIGDSGAFTVTTWFNPSSLAAVQSGLFSRGRDSFGAGWSAAIFLRSDSTLQGAIVASSGVQYSATGTTKVNLNEWRHVALTLDTSANQLTLYLDGLEEASVAVPSSVLRSSTVGFSIGRGNLSSELFRGTIDELRIYNTALDSSQIRQLITEKVVTTTGSFNDMLAYYRFDEGIGGYLYDLVGGNDGVLTNMDTVNNWVYSGASLGDQAAFSYAGGTVTVGHQGGDTMTIEAFSAPLDGMHLYVVNDKANNTNTPLATTDFDTTHYYGMYLVPGTSGATPLVNVDLSYGANANILANNNGDSLVFVGRGGNSELAWKSRASAIFTNNTALDALKLFGQESGTELALAQSTYLTPPGSGYALDFDGINDHVVVDDDDIYDVSAVTIETWVYWDGGTLAEFLTAKGNNELEIHINGVGATSTGDSAIRFIPTTGVYIDSPEGSFTPNAWHHLACVYDPTNAKGEIWIDGVKQNVASNGTNPVTTNITTSATDFHLGIRAGETLPFDGKMDEVRIWNTALDSAVIRKWMCKKLDTTHENIFNIIGYYRFDQQNDTNLIDLIGGNHGVLNNMDAATDWVTSGAALGDESVVSYNGSDLSIAQLNGDSMSIGNYNGPLDGIHLYRVGEASNSNDFYGASAVEDAYYFGVFKVGADTTTYEVEYYYGNGSLAAVADEYRVGLAKRDHNADPSWVAEWFNGSTDTATNFVILSNQTGTEYAGIVSANNALHFDGVNDFVLAPNSALYNFDTDDDFTVSLWAKLPSTQVTTSSPRNELITMRTGGGAYPFAIRVENQSGTVNGRVFGGRRDASATKSRLSSTTQINDNNWHHIAYTKVGDALSLYVDGVLEATGLDSSVTTTSTTGSLRLGYRGGAYHVIGALDEVRIYSRGLCEEEIQLIMGCELDTVYNDSLVLYYSFNQGVADSVNTGLDSLIDLSGNDNHGTLNSFTLSGSASNWTTGTDGVSGTCPAYVGPELYVLSEGDTILHLDSTASVGDSTYLGSLVMFQAYDVQYALYNPGGDTLELDTIFFTGADSAECSVTYPAVVLPGDTGVFTVTVTPTDVDSIEAYVNVQSNVCSTSPYRYQIQADVLGYAGAMNFDGTDDYISISDAPVFDFDTSGFSIEAWFRMEGTGFNGIIGKWGVTNNEWSITPEDSNMRFLTFDGTATDILTANDAFDLNTWTHVAATWNAETGQKTIFINGNPVATSTESVVPDAGTAITIGSEYATTWRFDGDIDEVRIWNRPLDSAEIAANLYCELNGSECGLVAYYNFNSDTAVHSGTNTGLTTIGDSTGNGNDGTAMNMAMLGTTSNWVGQSDSVNGDCQALGDLVRPVAYAVANHDVYLNAMGYAILDSNAADSGSCDYYSGIFEFQNSRDTVFCGDNGDTIWMRVLDNGGLVDSALFVVNVIDTLVPTVQVQNITVYLSATGTVSIDTTDVNNNSFDNCAIDTMWLSQYNFTCADSNANSVWFFAQDVSGNTDSASATVTVLDTVPPTAIAQNLTIYLDSTGAGSIDTTDLNNGSFDNCAIDTMWLSQSNFSCADTNGVTDTLFVRDVSGNLSMATATVTILDTMPPFISAAGGVFYLDGTGSVTIDTTDINVSTYDNCVTDTMWLSQYTFSCADSNNNTVTFYARDLSGNTDSVDVTVTIEDTLVPTVQVQNITVYLSATGTVSIDTTDVNNNSFDNCAIDTMWLSQYNFTCADSNANTVWFFARDVSGNTDSASATVTVLDTVPPTAIAQNLTIYLDSTGAASIDTTDLNNGSFDNCAIDTMWLSQSSFSCADTNGVTDTLFVRDVSGNLSMATATVTILDTMPPFISAAGGVFYLDGTGSVTIDTTDINVSTYDNCVTDTMWLSQYTFSCADSNNNTVTFYARDLSGNTDSVDVTVTIEDTLVPTVQVQNITVYLSATGTVSIDTTDVNNNSFDNCAIDTMWLSQYDFTCADSNANTVWFFAQDVSGNTDSASATVTVLDTVPPTAIAQNLTIYLDSTGAASIDTTDLNNGSFDNCAIDTMWLSQSNFSCADTNGVTDTLFVRDVSGNLSMATATVTILDTMPPFISAAGGVFYLDGTGSVSIDTTDINVSTYDNCVTDTMWLSQYTFSCADSNNNTVTFYARDLSGNTDSVDVTVTIEDTLVPTVQVQNITVYLSATGTVSIDTTDINNNSFDNCAIDTMWLSQYNFTCADSNANTVWFFAQDVSGNTDSASATVTLLDTVPPTAIAQNLTIYLDSTGAASIDTTDLNNGSFDNCAIDTMWLSQSNFSCADTNGVTDTLFVRDVSGNLSMATATVTILDTMPPFISAAGGVFYLDGTGSVSIDTTDINVSTYDNCVTDTMWLSQYTFNCADSNNNTVTFYARDLSGNTDSVDVTVTIEDTLVPTVQVQNITVYLSATGTVSIDTTDINNNSFDNCAIDTMWLSQYDFTCADSNANTVWFFAQDVSGNTDSASATVTVLDTVPPTAIAQNLTIYLDSTGAASIDTTDLNNGSFDNCAIDTMWLSQSSFSCADTNGVTDTLFVRDVSGNLSMATATVTIMDTMPPFISAAGGVFYLDGTGSVTIDTTDINVSTYDNCVTDTMWLSQYTFSCADSNNNTVTFYARDLSGNTDSVDVTVTIEDTLVPTVQVQNITVYLSATGTVSIDTTDINNNSFDNCAIDTMWLSQYNFTCADSNANTVWFFAQDVSGNTDSASATVTVLDTVPPTAIAQNLTIYLDSTGAASIDTTDVNNNSFDNCAIDTMWLSQSSFSCADTNGVTDTLFLRDVSGNLGMATATVTVLDTLIPIIAVTNDTIYLNSGGVATLDTGMVNNGTSDNCAVDSLWLSQTTFSCADTNFANPVTFYARDVSGNTDSFVIIIIVVDSLPPVLVTKDDTVYLDSNGQVSIDTTNINNGTADNCLLDTMWLSIDSFTCADTLDSLVWLYARDRSGNIDSATATVRVLDTLPPVPVVSPITVYLDSTGAATIAADTLDAGSFDNCAVDSIYLDQYNFGCADTAAANVVWFYAMDVSGNVDSVQTTVTVLDTQPSVVIPRNITAYLDGSGSVSITASMVDSASTDNCAIDTIWLDQYDFTCADSNANTVTLFVQDISGNVDSANAIVTVLDTVLPTVLTQNVTVYLDSFGALTIGPDTIDGGSFDNCAIDSTWVLPSSYTCSDTLGNTAWLFVRDVSGNLDSASATVTVLDTLAPIVVTNNVTIYLDSAGSANILPDTVDNGTSDNCDVALTWLSDSAFSCADTSSVNTIWLYAQDVSGNMDSATAIVTVLDTQPPVLLTQNLNIALDSFGTMTVAHDSADAGTNDNCQLDSVWLSQQIFTCSDVGINTVTFYGVDISGNLDSTNITVTVVDDIAPQVYAQDLTVTLDSFGAAMITALDVDSGSWDSCGIASYAIDQSTFDCSDVGSNVTVTLTVTDIHGNVSSDSSEVTVVDDIAPQVITQNITVYLDAAGTANITSADINNGSWDSCGIASIALDDSSFICSDIGANTVSLTVTDVNGNSASSGATVTVLDTLGPQAIPFQSTVSVYLDSTGVVAINPSVVDSASTDNCSFTMVTDITEFDCEDAGFTLPVVLTVTDSSGNVDSATAFVFVDDTIPPIPFTQDTTVALDSNGQVSITPYDVLDVLSDTCAISSLTIDTSDFTCANTGSPVTVTVTVIDTNGNTGVDSALVTVIDDMLPAVLVNDTTVYLDSNGIVVIDSAALDSGSFDNCGIASIIQERDTFTCADISAPVQIWVVVTDVNGNKDSLQSTVTVVDTIAPVVLTYFDTTRYLNVLGSRNVAVNHLDSASYDNCAIGPRSRVPTIVTCASAGDTVIATLTVEDNSGNVATGQTYVWAIDTHKATIVTQDIDAYLDSSGAVTISAAQIDSGSADACGIDTMWLDQYDYTCADVGTNTVTIFVLDVNGNLDSNTAAVTVIDTVAPTTFSLDSITVYLNDSGTYVMSPAEIELGSWDSCGIDSFYLSDTLFDCADVAVYPSVTLFADDVNGNTGSSNTVVEVLDTVSPIADPVDTLFVTLDANGIAVITGIDANNNSFDACGIANHYIDTTNFDCSGVGLPISATYAVVDPSGNTDTADLVIVVNDTVAPVAIAQSLTVTLDTNGTVSITPAMINNGSYDSCGIDTIYIDTANFDCANTAAPVMVTLTVEDVNGNQDTATAFVTVVDTIAPVVTAQNFDLFLDASGQGVLDTSDVNAISTDNCFIDTMTLSQVNFDCGDAGDTFLIVLTGFDASGNSDTAHAYVYVHDTVNPVALSQDIDVYLDANGQASITYLDLDSGSYDSCGIVSYNIDSSNFSCANVGAQVTVTLVVTDPSGNMDSTTSVVTVIDTVSPTAISLNAYTVYLNSVGTVTISSDSVNNGSYDSCGIASISLDDSVFVCSDLNQFPVITMTVVDVNGNSSTSQTTVTVLDTVNPIAAAQDIDVYLDATGNATIVPLDIDNGSSDNCAIQTYALDTSSFNCSDVNQVNKVVLTVTDSSGNSDTAEAYVTVIDTVAPVAVSQNITIYLDANGNDTIDATMINNGSSDACGIDSMALSDTAFSCADTGVNVIELYVYDVNGNGDTVEATVTVIDTVSPSANAYASIEVFLDSTGNASITHLDIDSLSSDACGIDTMLLSQYDFDCSHVGAANSVTLTVVDVNGNSSTAQTTVIVSDTVAPAVFAQADTVYLDSAGQASITYLDLDAGSWDSCGIASYVLDSANFGCENTFEPVLVTLIVTDVNGNESSDSAYVVVVDTIHPVISCQADIVVDNDSGACGAVVGFNEATATDVCGIDTIFRIDTVSLDSGQLFPVGTSTITYVALDANGNGDTCSFNITVMDTQAPVILCENDTVICDSTFTFNLPDALDNCSIDSVHQIAGIASGEFYPVGTTINTFVATDASGNTDTCSVTITRDDFPTVADAGVDTALCEALTYDMNANTPAVGVATWISLGAASVADTTSPSSTVSDLVIGENSFVWQITNGVCPASLDTVTIRVDELPDALTLPSNQSLCDLSDTLIAGDSIVVGAAHWNLVGDASLTDSVGDTAYLTNMGIGTITLIRINENGVCPSSSDTMSIYNNAMPVVDAGPNVSRFAAKTVTFSPTVANATAYSWSPAELFEDPTVMNATASTLNSVWVELEVTSDSGCVASDSLYFRVATLDSIPTGITPNGDGVNDVWNIEALQDYPSSEVFIYDQSGRELFHSIGYDVPWDGTYNGVALPRASYYWIIDLKDGVNEPMTGIITIIK